MCAFIFTILLRAGRCVLKRLFQVRRIGRVAQTAERLILIRRLMVQAHPLPQFQIILFNNQD
jgi:hypothetical protein